MVLLGHLIICLVIGVAVLFLKTLVVHSFLCCPHLPNLNKMTTLQDQDTVLSDQSGEIFSIDREQVAKLNDLFWKSQLSQSAQKAAFASAALGVGGAVVSTGGAFATAPPSNDAAAAAAASIAAGVTNAINMIKAIDGIGLAAFGVALAPMGFMVTLRVLNMVLSRV